MSYAAETHSDPSADGTGADGSQSSSVSSLGHGSSATRTNVVDKEVEFHLPAEKLSIVGPSYRQEKTAHNRSG